MSEWVVVVVMMILNLYSKLKYLFFSFLLCFMYVRMYVCMCVCGSVWAYIIHVIDCIHVIYAPVSLFIRLSLVLIYSCLRIALVKL